jgi:hypothetical protein
MRKLAFQVGVDVTTEERRRSRWPRVLLILFLLIGIGPLALEGGAICLANWREFMGVSSTSANTPVLDQVQESLHDMNDGLWRQVTPWFRRLPWDPQRVIPAAALVMAVAMLMLRR